MFNSPKYSYFLLRLGLSAVFLWFGIDKLVHTSYWITAWTPDRLISIFSRFNITETQLVYAGGVFEIIVGASLLTSVFAKIFSLLAIFYLTVILFINGLTGVTIRDLGLLGGLFAVLLWPNFRKRF